MIIFANIIVITNKKVIVRVQRGLLGLIFAGFVPLGCQNPYSIIGYSVAIF